MAPGLNGGGRPTGTVPKTKTHNESTRDHGTQPHRRDFSFNHMNNNLAPADWQSFADFLPAARSRKESNTSASRYSEPNEIQGDESAACPENQWLPPVMQPQANYCSEDEVRWEDKRHKSNNILNFPEQTHMNRRLVQICDYINQTSNLMEIANLQSSGTPIAENGLPETNFTHAGPSASSPDSVQQRNFPSQPTGSVPKSSDSTLRRNELKMKMEESQRKVLELREESAIMALKQKAQEQLKEAHTARRAWLAAAASSQSQTPSASALSEGNIQETLNNIQRFYDGRNEIGEMLGCSSDCTSEVVQLQNKLKELQMKKSQMDQKILQYASFNPNLDQMLPEPAEMGNIPNGSVIHVGDQNIEDKIAELAALKEQLNRMQGIISTIPSLNNTQDSEVDETIHMRSQQSKQDNRTQAVSHGSPGPSMSAVNLQAKSLRLREARARLHHLQELLNFVEKLRDSGKPVPEKVLTLLNNVSGFSDEGCVPLMDMSENSFQDLYQEVAAAVASDKQRQPAKPNNMIAKIRSRTQQLEEWMKKDDLMSSINTDINSQTAFSYQETPTTATWGGSTHGTLEDHNTRSPDYSSDGETENGGPFLPLMNPSIKPSSAPTIHKESAPCTNIVRDIGIDSASISGVNCASSVPLPQNTWGKQSSGSGTSLPHGIWTPSSSLNAQLPNRQENACASEETAPNPDNRWIAQQILQMQAQLQQMCQNVTEKHHNNPMINSSGSMWLPPFYTQNGPGPGFAGYNQFVASQQHQLPINQLLINSLNQCCQLIWHQQCELMGVKEALQLIQQQQQQQHGIIEPEIAAAPAPVDQNPDSHSNLERATIVNRSSQNNASPVLSVPHPHYFYPPYGNNLNFESFQHHSSPVGTFIPSPAGALNNQVPPGNRANNYWDNFRSYSRQNLLSVRSKTNEGLLAGERERTQDPNMTQSQQNLHHTHPPVDVMTFNLSQNHKEKLNTHQSSGSDQACHSITTAEQPVRCSSIKPSQAFHQNNCSDSVPQPEPTSKGACKKIRAEKKEQTPPPAVEASSMNRSWNSIDESVSTSKGKRHSRNTVSTEDLPRNSNFKRKTDCKINSIRTDNNSEHIDSLEEAFYSEVAALISVNERQLNYLLQLFRDLKHLNSDSDRQAVLLTIHNLANRASATASVQQPACCVKESQQIETMGQEELQEASSYQECQPRNSSANHKETITLQHSLSNGCSKLDWEIRSISVAMLPFLKAHFGGICGPSLLEQIRLLVLQMIPMQYRQDELVTSLEGALLKFQGCRLRDVYEELLGVVADVLINDLTFHRYVASVNNNNNTNIINNNNNNEMNGDILVEEGEEGGGEDEEGAVGGVAVVEVDKQLDDNSPMLLSACPPVANQMVRCNKSDAVSEADLAEADQSRLPSGASSRSCPIRLNGNSESEDTASVQDRREPFLMEEADHHSLSISHQRAEIERGLDHVPVQLNGAQALDAHEGGLEHPLNHCSNTNSEVGQM